MSIDGGKGEQDTIVAQLTDVLSNGLETYDVHFDNNRGAFVTEWIEEEQWTDADVVAVRVVSSVETDPIDILVERDDDGDGVPEDSGEWVRVTAGDTPVQFPAVSGGDAHYRVLLRYIRPTDFVRDIDVGFVR